MLVHQLAIHCTRQRDFMASHLRRLWAQKDYLDDPDVVAKRRAAKATAAAEETKSAPMVSRKSGK